MKKQSWILVFGLLLFYSDAAFSWSEHHTITRTVLGAQEGMSSKKVVFHPFEELLKKMSFENAAEFNQKIKIHKSFRFEPHLGEQAGKEVSLLEVLSIYSDEPDWKMDQELFSESQYPELWREEYVSMGGRKGTPSQAFRHMYWQKFTLRAPFVSAKYPKFFESMGEAPERAQVFMDLASQAKKQGEDYWAARFTANALHYIEDLAQPFHTTQTPTKYFMAMPFIQKQGHGRKNYIQQMTNLIAYYHYSFEDYVSHQMLNAFQGRPNPESEELAEALKSKETSFQVSAGTDTRGIAKAVAQISMKKASDAGQATVIFFPKITVPYEELVPTEFMNAAWWDETLKRGQTPSEGKQKYFKVVKEMFQVLNGAISSVMTQ